MTPDDTTDRTAWANFPDGRCGMITDSGLVHWAERLDAPLLAARVLGIGAVGEMTMGLANGVDLEPRVDALEEWRASVDEQLFPDLLALRRIAETTAGKVDELIHEARTTRAQSLEAKNLAEAALAKRDSTIPKMRERMESFSSEIEETVRNAKGSLEHAAKFASQSSDKNAIKAELERLLADQALAQQAKAYGDWKRTVAAVGQKATVGLLALSGTGILYILKLAWEAWRSHH